MTDITESSSEYLNLDQLSTSELLRAINQEDQQVAKAVGEVLPQIEKLIDTVFPRMQKGGRLFYIGAGTSGRLGILDASECPPTFGVSHNLVIGLIAGGDGAIRKAVEFAEDDIKGAWKDLQPYQPTPRDTVIGIAASGKTPYVVGGIREARKNGLLTGAISCNPESMISREADYPVEVVVGPEVVSGSTRMKAGTAQKMVLNMISTSLMVKMGRVKGNRMVDMQLSNNKLVDRGIRMLMEELHLDQKSAADLLKTYGSVREALKNFKN